MAKKKKKALRVYPNVYVILRIKNGKGKLHVIERANKLFKELQKDVKL